ncbi:hypothetical protein ACJX0J_020983, partial [Zea mays]
DAELAGNYNEFVMIILQIQHAVEMDMPLPIEASIPRDEQDNVFEAPRAPVALCQIWIQVIIEDKLEICSSISLGNMMI